MRLDSRLVGILLGVPDDQLIDDADATPTVPGGGVSDRKTEGRQMLGAIGDALARGEAVTIVKQGS